MEFLLDGFRAVTWQQGVMYLVGFALIYLAIQKDYEPALLLPMGFGAILVNLPSSGVLNQMVEGIGESQGIIQVLFQDKCCCAECRYLEMWRILNFKCTALLLKYITSI